MEDLDNGGAADDSATAKSGTQAARVTRTGIALVHEGELVLPAAGSEAQAEQVMSDARTSVQYFFPVEIEVRGAPEPLDLEEIMNQALMRLARGLGSM